MITPARQRGTAIVVALFVTALVAAMSVAMMMRARTDTRRTELLLNYIQSNLYVDGAVDGTIQTLNDNWKHQQTGRPVDHLPAAAPISHMNGATITNVTEDAQGLFNLNNLVDKSYLPLFINLLRLVDPTLTSDKAHEILLAVVDWITPGIKNSRFDQYYAKQQPPWRAAHHPMVSVSELLLVKGMTPALFARLVPFVTALPGKTPININSAPLPVLMAFSPTISKEMAMALMNALKQTPVTDKNQLKNFPVVQAALSAQNNPIVFTSQYFLVKTEVALGNQRETVYTLLSRTTKNKQSTTGIVWQSKGTL